MRAIVGAMLCAAGCMLAPAYSATKAEDVQTFTLKNGMEVLVVEDHSIPNANMYIFWKVGSRNEHPGITGLAHFFEHMMFNGAKKYGPKMFDRTMEANGGANNAYTTEDLTVYTDWFPADALETMFDLEADRIANLDINAKVVESERGVVASERSTGLENSNYRMLSEEVKGVAFRAHPYSWSVIGHESDIANWKLSDLQQFHKTYYAPNNAVMVVAGDVKFADVERLAKQYIEPIPAQPQPRAIHTVEPKQTGERRVNVFKASVSTPNLMIAYHISNSKHQDRYALTLLNDILFSSNSSRLQKALIDEQQLATGVFSDLPDSFDPNLFYIYAVAAEQTSSRQLEQAIYRELQKVIEHGVTEQELTKVKNQRLVNFYREMATINGKANTLGTYHVYSGDYKAVFTAPEQFNTVTIADVQRVAKTYFQKTNRTVGVLSNVEDNNETDL